LKIRPAVLPSDIDGLFPIGRVLFYLLTANLPQC